MDELRDQFHHGRREMLEAFLALSTAARRSGIDEDEISRLHSQFFDGNVEVKRAFRAAILLSEIRR